MNVGTHLAEYEKAKRNKSYQDCLYSLRILVGVIKTSGSINKYDFNDVLAKLIDFESVIKKYYSSEVSKYELALSAFKERNFQGSWEILTNIGNQFVQEEKKKNI